MEKVGRWEAGVLKGARQEGKEMTNFKFLIWDCKREGLAGQEVRR